MSPKETKQLNANLDARIKAILEEESQKTGMSQTEYLERLIEGTLPGHLEEKIEGLRLEIAALRKQLKK